MRLPTAQLFAVCVAIWGTTWIAITFQLGRVPPEYSIAWRFALAALLLAGFCRLRRYPLRFSVSTHALLAALGLSMFCLSYLAVYHAERLLVSGLVAMGYSTSPLVNMVISRVAGGTPMGGRVATGALLGVAGVGLVFWPEVSHLEQGGAYLPGAALIATAVVASAVGNVFAVRLERLGVNVWQKMAWGMAYGAAGCALAAAVRGQPVVFDFSFAYVGSLLYLVVFGSVGAFAAFLTLLERIGAARAGYIGVMTPIVALLLSGVFEHFHWQPLTFLGIAVAVAGNVAVLRTSRVGA